MTDLIIVRRGKMDRFQYLQDAFARDAVEIVWDRRRGERRGPRDPAVVERRYGERRDQPGADLPADWEARQSADRRQQQDVRMLERRGGERRGPAPQSWPTLDFIVVARPDTG